MLTTDPKHEGIDKPKENGQNEAYLVLSKEEREKGFVRPFRQSYTHVGRYYENEPVILDEPYRNLENKKTYVATIPVILNEDGSPKGSTYITRKELKQWQKDKHIGGCGATTRMAEEIAETYARKPSFYGASYCTGCCTHVHVGELVWEGTNERVGS